MRLGKVRIVHEYVVDLDNLGMIDDAKEAIYEDFKNAILRNPEELFYMISFEEDKNLTENDIPEFLKIFEEYDN